MLAFVRKATFAALVDVREDGRVRLFVVNVKVDVAPADPYPLKSDLKGKPYNVVAIETVWCEEVHRKALKVGRIGNPTDSPVLLRRSQSACYK